MRNSEAERVFVCDFLGGQYYKTETKKRGDENEDIPLII